MEKLLLVEQWGSCDANGKSIGHISKVLREYVNLLQGNFSLGVIAHTSLLKEIENESFESIHMLNRCICEEGKKKIYTRIIDKIKLLLNIHSAWNQKGYDIIWFFRGDFFVLLYAMLHRKVKGTRYYCLMYYNQYGQGIVAKIIDFIYRCGIKRFDGIIYTQEKMRVPHSNIFYMPDYLYKPQMYQKYIAQEKENKAVCVGLMNYDKDLEGIIKVFNKIGYPLEIVGCFLDKQYERNLRNIARENIIIEDKILSNEDYNYKLGSARFAIIPYKMPAYIGRTSGVLQESMFLQAIPVAPRQLLEDNGIPGIGYGRLDELMSGEIDIYSISNNKAQLNNILQDQKLVLEKYNWNLKKNDLVKWMKGNI